MNFRPQQLQSARALTVCPTLTDERYLLTLHQLSDNLVRGCVGSIFLDHGENFVQTRTYQSGDSSNSIDWKASARAQKLIVKEHESLRQTIVSIVVDRSGSMTAGSLDHSKYAAACILSGSLSLASLKVGCPTRFVLSDAPAQIEATLSTPRLSSSIATLRRFTPRNATPLSQCLRDAFLRVTRRQLVFVLSDFHDPCSTDAIALLARSHEVLLIHLHDTLETRTPAGTTLRLQPSEGGPAHYTRAQKTQCDHSAAQRVASLGLSTVTIDPTQPISTQMRQFLGLRRHA